jgi:hypothetical protein
MNNNNISDRPNRGSQSCVSSFRSDSGQCSSDMRATILSGHTMNAEQASGMGLAIQESINRTFGGISLEEQLEADKRAYEIKPMF